MESFKNYRPDIQAREVIWVVMTAAGWTHSEQRRTRCLEVMEKSWSNEVMEKFRGQLLLPLATLTIQRHPAKACTTDWLITPQSNTQTHMKFTLTVFCQTLQIFFPPKNTSHMHTNHHMQATQIRQRTVFCIFKKRLIVKLIQIRQADDVNEKRWEKCEKANVPEADSNQLWKTQYDLQDIYSNQIQERQRDSRKRAAAFWSKPQFTYFTCVVLLCFIIGTSAALLTWIEIHYLHLFVLFYIFRHVISRLDATF